MAGSDLVQSVIRGLDILRVVGAAGNGIRLNEVAATMNLNVTTTHNLVRTLAARGFVEKNGPQLYLGPAVPQLGDLFHNSSITRQAEGAMRRLANVLPDAVVTFGRPSGSEIVVTRRLSPDQPGRLQKPSDRTFNLYANASGLLCLAMLDEERLEPILVRYPFVEFGAHLWRDQARLDEFLDTVRLEEYAALPFDDRGRFRVAAPVFGGGGELAACLGVCMHTDGKAKVKKQMLNELVKAAETISG